jgi:hypothetical protein
MSSTQPNGDPSAEIPERQPVPQIAVLLTREQAYTASVALVDEVEKQIRYLTGDEEAGDLGEAHIGGLSSIDAHSTARSLMRALSALEAVGWPHQHAWSGCIYSLSLAEASGRGPWGETAPVDHRAWLDAESAR